MWWVWCKNMHINVWKRNVSIETAGQSFKVELVWGRRPQKSRLTAGTKSHFSCSGLRLHLGSFIWPHPTQSPRLVSCSLLIGPRLGLGHGWLTKTVGAVCGFVSFLKAAEDKQAWCLKVTSLAWLTPACQISRPLGSWHTQATNHTTEEELGIPWMIALVGVPLIALKMCSESGRALFMPSSTGLIWREEKRCEMF